MVTTFINYVAKEYIERKLNISNLSYENYWFKVSLIYNFNSVFFNNI